jgi:hypothetical protein
MSHEPTSLALEYETPTNVHDVRVELAPDGGVTITVPTRRTAGRYIAALIVGNIGALLIALFAWLVFALFATKKPRAVLRLTPEEFIAVETRDDSLGIRVTARSWPIADIGELRRNRYEKGLWITIRGRDSFNLLEDVDAPMLDAVAAAIADASQRLAAARK